MESLSVKCLVPRCGKMQGRARRLCNNHYQSFREAVNAGQLCWRRLEGMGLAGATNKVTTHRRTMSGICRREALP